MVLLVFFYFDERSSISVVILFVYIDVVDKWRKFIVMLIVFLLMIVVCLVNVFVKSEVKKNNSGVV